MKDFVKHLLIVVNFIGVLIGLRGYLFQLLETTPFFWIFVIDCPLAAFFFILYLFGVKNKYFEALMRLYCFKYGIWTIVVTFSAPLILTSPFAYRNMLIHAGLFIQSFLLIKQRLRFKHFSFGLLMLLINDFFDYIFLTHPVINNNLFVQTAVFTVFLSIFSTIFFIIYYKNKIKE